jgi:protein-disulfide isomerase
MRRYFVCLTLLVLIAALAVALAQAPAKSQSAAAASALPSKATLDSFLKHVFGFDPTVSATVAGIKPSPAPGIVEVTLNFKSGQNSSEKKLFILPGQRQAVGGEMMAFPGDSARSGAARPSDAAINNFVRQATGGVNPAITWSIAEVKPRAVAGLTQVSVLLKTPQGSGVVAFLVTADQKHALRGEVVPFGRDPYAADRARLDKGINGPARGPANAPITIVEFADLQCPACKTANPEIQRLVNDMPNVRFVFQQFPLTNIHKWAFEAAVYGDCVYRENPAAFWKFLDAVYGAQEQITKETGNSHDAGKKASAKLKDLASQAGVNGQKVAACAEESATADRINRSVALGKEMQIGGTPTVFVGGRKISNLSQMPYDTLKRMAQHMAGQSK